MRNTINFLQDTSNKKDELTNDTNTEIENIRTFLMSELYR